MNDETKDTKTNKELKDALNTLRNNQKKCPHCGMMLIEGAKFCKNCGKKI